MRREGEGGSLSRSREGSPSPSLVGEEGCGIGEGTGGARNGSGNGLEDLFPGLVPYGSPSGSQVEGMINDPAAGRKGSASSWAVEKIPTPAQRQQQPIQLLPQQRQSKSSSSSTSTSTSTIPAQGKGKGKDKVIPSSNASTSNGGGSHDPLPSSFELALLRSSGAHHRPSPIPSEEPDNATASSSRLDGLDQSPTPSDPGRGKAGSIDPAGAGPRFPIGTKRRGKGVEKHSEHAKLLSMVAVSSRTRSSSRQSVTPSATAVEAISAQEQDEATDISDGEGGVVPPKQTSGRSTQQRAGGRKADTKTSSVRFDVASSELSDDSDDDVEAGDYGDTEYIEPDVKPTISSKKTTSRSRVGRPPAAVPGIRFTPEERKVLIELLERPADTIPAEDLPTHPESGVALCANAKCFGADGGQPSYDGRAVIEGPVPEGRENVYNLCRTCRCSHVENCYKPNDLRSSFNNYLWRMRPGCENHGFRDKRGNILKWPIPSAMHLDQLGLELRGGKPYLRDPDAPTDIAEYTLLVKHGVKTLLDLTLLPADAVDQADIQFDEVSGAQLCCNPFCGRQNAVEARGRAPDSGGNKPRGVVKAFPETRNGQFNVCERCRCGRVVDCWRPKARNPHSTLAISLNIGCDKHAQNAPDGRSIFWNRFKQWTNEMFDIAYPATAPNHVPSRARRITKRSDMDIDSDQEVDYVPAKKALSRERNTRYATLDDNQMAESPPPTPLQALHDTMDIKPDLRDPISLPLRHNQGSSNTAKGPRRSARAPDYQPSPPQLPTVHPLLDLDGSASDDTVAHVSGGLRLAQNARGMVHAQGFQAADGRWWCAQVPDSESVEGAEQIDQKLRELVRPAAVRCSAARIVKTRELATVLRQVATSLPTLAEPIMAIIQDDACKTLDSQSFGDVFKSTLAKHLRPEQTVQCQDVLALVKHETSLSTECESCLACEDCHATSTPVPKEVPLTALLENCDPQLQTEILNCLDLGGIKVPQLDNVCHNEMAKEHVMSILSESHPNLVEALRELGPLFGSFEGFYLLATAGSITFHHHNGGGCWTQVEVLRGSKVWSTWEERDGPALHFPLPAGSGIIMPPYTLHTVYTPEATICRGRHFLRYETVLETVDACYNTADGQSTNEFLPIVQIYLCVMLIALSDSSFVAKIGFAPGEVRRFAQDLITALKGFKKMFPGGHGTEKDQQDYAAVEEVLDPDSESGLFRVALTLGGKIISRQRGANKSAAGETSLSKDSARKRKADHVGGSGPLAKRTKTAET